MVNNRMLGLELVVIVIFINSYVTARPAPDKYDGIPSGVLHPISGVVPISVHKQHPQKHGRANDILHTIRQKVDRNDVDQLDSSLRRDIYFDTLTPQECTERYGIRDGVIKHVIRGVRDLGAAVVRDIEELGNLLSDIPLAPNIINGVGEAITFTLCGVEDAFSDFASGFDSGPDIITTLLVKLIELHGSLITELPGGVVNLTEVALKLGVNVVDDIVGGLELGVEDLVGEVEKGLEDVVSDVGSILSGVESTVGTALNGVQNAVSMVVGGLGKGVSSIVNGVGNAVDDIIGAL